MTVMPGSRLTLSTKRHGKLIESWNIEMIITVEMFIPTSSYILHRLPNGSLQVKRMLEKIQGNYIKLKAPTERVSNSMYSCNALWQTTVSRHQTNSQESWNIYQPLLTSNTILCSEFLSLSVKQRPEDILCTFHHFLNKVEDHRHDDCH